MVSVSLKSLGLSKDPKDAQRRPSCFPDDPGVDYSLPAEQKLWKTSCVLPLSTCIVASVRRPSSVAQATTPATSLMTGCVLDSLTVVRNLPGVYAAPDPSSFWLQERLCISSLFLPRPAGCRGFARCRKPSGKGSRVCFWMLPTEMLWSPLRNVHFIHKGLCKSRLSLRIYHQRKLDENQCHPSIKGG
jgi:hypothetical protein